MEKLKMHSLNKVESNIEKIAALFPNCITERINADGKVEHAIDFDVLKQELSTEIVEGLEERYQFTWPDKKKAILAANAPINKTLRPCREESVDFDTTENLYIEGDNLEVLKLLQETYLNKIKMIYIDPPYNTGNNLIYKNDFSRNFNSYMQKTDQYDEMGNLMVANTESNGRFHTDWLNMIFPVLKISRDLISNDGFIAIAIDDNELYNLKKVTDEIFGENNYIGTIVTRSNPQGRNKNNIDPVHEYHLLYSKDINNMKLLKIRKKSSKVEYGYFMRSGTNSRKYERPLRFYPMLMKNNRIFMITQEEYEKIYKVKSQFDEKFIAELKKRYEGKGYQFILPIASNGEEKVWQRSFERVLNEYNDYIYDNGQIKIPISTERTPISLWNDDVYSNVSYGTNKLKLLFESNSAIFDFTKSVCTVRDIVSLNTENNDIVLDFFPGAATTAHAVMQLNTEDGGKRKFIMVQLPELTDEKSEAYKAGYKNICEIGKERIRRAGQKIKEENPLTTQDLDTGFRVLKIDSSNMKDVYYTPKEYTNEITDIFDFVDNVKEDRSDEDLLFQVMLDLGTELSSKIVKKEIAGKAVYDVAEGHIIACFADGLTNEIVTEIAKQKPSYFITRDSALENDSVAANYEQIFNKYSPATEKRVL